MYRTVVWLSLGFALKSLITLVVLLIVSIEQPMTWQFFLIMTAVAISNMRGPRLAAVFPDPGWCLEQRHFGCRRSSHPA